MVKDSLRNTKNGFKQFQDLTQSQDHNTNGIKEANQQIQDVNAQAYMRKFAVTSSNFYAAPTEQLP